MRLDQYRPLLLVFVLIFVAPSVGLSSGLLSFKEWKTKRIQEAQAVFNSVKVNKSQRYTYLRGDEPEKSEKIWLHKFRRSQHNIQMAKELSANDYFVMYLMPRARTNSSLYLEAIRKMSRSEIAEILQNYHRQISEKDIQKPTDRGLNFGANREYTPRSKGSLARLSE